MNQRDRESLFQRLERARLALGLPDRASISQIRGRYRELSKHWHPDHCREDPELCKQRQAEINAAYDTLMDYCNNYQYSFREEDIEQYPSGEDFWWKHFGEL